MEDVKEKKREILEEIEHRLNQLSPDAVSSKNREIENRLFEFANFLESRIALFYSKRSWEISTISMIKKSYDYNKIVVLPLFNPLDGTGKMMKIDNFSTDLKRGETGEIEPDPAKCKEVPIDCIDIAIVPGLAFDEKGGRFGRGDGFFEKLLPSLPITTRKVAVAFEEQVYPQLPLETNDRPVDIIITEKRIIYKI